MAKSTPLLRRFLDRFVPGEKHECWEWEASKDRYGYGQIRNGCRLLRAHRVSYELFVGPIPDGLHVRHKCDNPCCVNPNHLEVGTNADNVRDKMERGRHRGPRGSKSGSAKLCEPEVVLIKKFLIRHPPVKGKNGGPCNFLARWFGVSASTVSLIHAQERWAHVA